VLKTAGLTLAALTAFAANSILCRLALGHQQLDPASFTLIRLASGALALWLIVLIGGRRATLVHGTWSSAGMLFVYAAAFSFAYLSLSAGTGALILFAAVQITMMAAGLRAGERLQARGWFGIALAVGGLGYLVSPGVSAPSPLGAALMATAGVAWGFYSLEGRRSTQATAATMGNFILATPFALLLSLITFAQLRLSPTGMLLALLSGAVTSGMGYVVWYAVLPTLGATRGATVQLAVPVLTALGGVMMLSEELTVRLVTSTVAIVMGIGLVLWRTERPSRDAAAH
jgi:drug/metabolite transporter (DMT)-like permease